MEQNREISTSNVRRFIRVFFSRRITCICFAVTMLIILIAVFAPVITPYDPNNGNLAESLQGASGKHWLGTDIQGRDVVTRLIYGARVSLLIGVVATMLGGAAGSLVGVVSGYFGGIVDNVIMRITEVYRAIPQVCMTMSLSVIFGRGIGNLMLLLSISSFFGFIRMSRGQVLRERSAEYITSRTVSGSGNLRIMLKHILPNSVSPLIVLMTQSIGGTIMAEAGLSFLGIGITAPTATWGGMINDGRQYLLTNPALALAPGVCVIILVVCLNVLGDGLRDAWDPRLRGTL